ncbi:MAG: DUF3710 domain-containing protein [Nocardioides sp.]
MKFRRKSAEAEPAAEVEETVDEAPVAEPGPTTGPFDVDDLDEDDELARMDLGALLIPAVEGIELRLQIDQESEEVQAVLLAGAEGAVEVRAFAAPRNGDLWGTVRPQLAADFAQRGGTASEREGRFGTEIVGQLSVKTADGRTGAQVSRIIGVNGPRWMLRATLLGKPAVEPETSGSWEDLIAGIAVRRGSHAMPVGAELTVTLPPRDQLVESGS